MIRRFQELPSTQSYCLENLDGFGEFEAVICTEQTQGIGRLGRNWISGPESLTFSVVARSDRIDDITVQASKCVKSALEHFGVDGLIIKWPNDLYLKQPGKKSRKIGGVLVNSVHAGEGNTYVIGVGLNIGGEALPYCTLAECGVALDKEAVFLRILNGIRQMVGAAEREKHALDELGFSHTYVNFQDKQYQIVSVTDRLQITDGYNVLTIDPEEYSYLIDTNTLCTKWGDV